MLFVLGVTNNLVSSIRPIYALLAPPAWCANKKVLGKKVASPQDQKVGCESWLLYILRYPLAKCCKGRLLSRYSAPTIRSSWRKTDPIPVIDAMDTE